MITTEHPSKAPHSTGIFAMLGAFLHTKGTGAPKVAVWLPALVVVFLALTATPALANSTHAVSKTIGEGEGSAAGQLELASNSGVAVSEAGADKGDIYVADTGNHRVDEFEANDTFIRAWGWGVGGGIGFETCTSMCVKGLSGSNPGEFEAPAFVAVDNSAGGEGDVYVADTGTGMIQKFTAEGRLEESWGVKGQIGEVPGPSVIAELTAGSNLVVATSGQFLGEFELEAELIGEGIPPGTKLGNCPSNNRCEMSNPATVTKTGVVITSPATGLGSLAGIAVNATAGDLFFYTDLVGAHVFEFERSGSFVQRWRAGYAPNGIAIDGAGDIYLSGGEGVLKFTSSGAPLPGGASGSASGLAVDQATNELYVDRGASIESFASSGTVIGAFGSRQLSAGGGAGLAVDSADGVVYEANASADQLEAYVLALEVNPNPGSASGVTATTATLNGEVNPEGSPVHECKFEYGTSSEYQATGEYEHSTLCLDEAGEPVQADKPLTGSAPVSVHADLKGLLIGTTYDFRLVAVHENPVTHETTSVPGDDEVFTTPPGPVIAGGEAKDLTESAAELTATVNPEGLPVIRCAFEYVAAEQYETEAPDPYAKGSVVKCEQKLAQISFGTEPVPVSAQLTGLSPNLTYHWRLSVKDANGEASGVDHTFVYSTAGTELPDHRAYEMVTPPFKNGALFGAVYFGLPPSVSEDGSRVIALTIQCFAPAESCNAARGTSGEPFEFTRTSTGWETTVLAPPAGQFSENTEWLYDATEGTALFSMPTGPAKEEEWYARSPGGSFVPVGSPEPPGTTGAEGISVGYTAATADLSHVIWEKGGTFAQGTSLYESAGTHKREPLLVGVTGGEGSSKLLATCKPANTALGSHTYNGGLDETAWNALSADGRTVYFTVCKSELYARVDGETSEAHTVRISPGAGDFRGASEDGSKAFFIEGEGLYESECTKECEKQGEERELIDVSAGSAKPEVQGVTAISSDGSHIYFVAKGALTAQPNAAGQSARAGRDNLYVYQRDARYPAGRIAYIVALSASEYSEWAGLRANVTPEGRFLVFESHGALTSDARGADVQIYRYDAATEQLMRVSVGQDGFDDNGNAGGEDRIVQAFGGEQHAGPPRGDPTMSNDGSFVFFESTAGLTPHALNNVPIYRNVGERVTETVYAENVYEWHEGHVSLISDGHDVSSANVKPCQTGSSVCLMGTDASGHNVFFTTADRLVPKDTDTQVDIYDARICEPETGNPCIEEPAPPLPPCDGEGCHGIPAATPSLLAPGTATFNGEGNATTTPPPVKKVTKKTVTCKKGFVKNKKSRCVKKPKKKKSKTKKSAHTNRRASR
jgi:hypothetical protein